jgi:hypothetical protein
VASPGPALARALRQVRDELISDQVAFAVVGGLAVSARAEPRLTRDVDVAVAVADDQDAEAVIRRMLARGYRVTATVEQRKTGRLATVRLETDAHPVIVDMLFATCGIEREIVAAAESLQVLPRLRLPVARAGHLIAMKVLSQDRNRPQDHDDARALLRIAPAAEQRRARAALALITRRGFARGHDLERRWQRLVRDVPGRAHRRRRIE